MSVLAELAVPVEDFPLGRALASSPEIQVELERIVPTGGEVLPFFWAWGGDVDALAAALSDDEAIEDVTVLDRLESGALLRATWTARPGLVEAIVESAATLLEVQRREDT